VEAALWARSLGALSEGPRRRLIRLQGEMSPCSGWIEPCNPSFPLKGHPRTGLAKGDRSGGVPHPPPSPRSYALTISRPGVRWRQDRLLALRHSNGNPLVRIYGRQTPICGGKQSR
jgi:hypothetical protein